MSDEKTVLETESSIPETTVDWLLETDIPAVAALTHRKLLGKPDTQDIETLWSHRNEYEPVRRILELQCEDGSWAPPNRDYKKYEGSLWQVIFLGELYANGDDERVKRAAEYAFSRQLPDGSWSCSGKPYASIPCLTANVGRSLARLGYADDERTVRALAHVADLYKDLGHLGCKYLGDYTLNGYCHMLAPKVLLFLGEIERDLWPKGAVRLRDVCIEALRDKEIFCSLPKQYKEFKESVLSLPKAELAEARERFIAERGPLEYGDKPGWLRLGFPISYNSDALESLLALATVGEKRRPEYEPALDVVLSAADEQMRWKLQTSFNGKMLADVEKKGQPSKWLTLRALLVLKHFG